MKIKRAGVLLLVLVALVVVGCGQTVSTPPAAAKVFEFHVGTANYGGTPQTFVLMIFRNSTPVSAGGHTVTITGPAGWNAGTPAVFSMSWREGRSGYDWAWFTGFPTVNTPAVSGTYTAETTLDGALRTETDTLDIASTIALTTPTATIGTTQVDASWTSVTGAISYQAVVQESTDATFTITAQVAGKYTQLTSYSFTGLSLDPVKFYRVVLRSFNFNLASGVVDPIPSQTNFSRALTASATPTGVRVQAGPRMLPARADFDYKK